MAEESFKKMKIIMSTVIVVKSGNTLYKQEFMLERSMHDQDEEYHGFLWCLYDRGESYCV